MAVRLAKEGRIEVTQRGEVVSVEGAGEIRGPIRLRAVVVGNGARGVDRRGKKEGGGAKVAAVEEKDEGGQGSMNG